MPDSLVADRTLEVGQYPGAGFVQRARNISGASVAEGAVVIVSATGTNADIRYSFTTTTTANDPLVMGVLVNGPVENGSVGQVMIEGFADKVLVDGTTDIAAGDYLGTFTSAGIAQKSTTSNGIFAVALEAYTTDDSNGEIKAIILGHMAARQAAASGSLGVDGLVLGDNEPITFGDGSDATIQFDATNLVINPRAAGSGDLTISNGSLHIGDTENADLTTGLSINQGAADDQIMALKSSDVNHGMSTVTEVDTYAFLKKATSTGALHIEGLGDGKFGFLFNADYTTDDTAKTTSGRAPMEFNARKKSGTSIGAPGANANIIAFQANGGTRVLIDEDGDLWVANSLQIAEGSAPGALTDIANIYAEDDGGSTRLMVQFQSGSDVQLAKEGAGTGGPFYGELYEDDGSTTQTLTDQDTWYTVTSLDHAGQSEGTTVDAVTDNDITINQADVYNVKFNCSWTGTTNGVYEIAVFVNGTEQGNIKCDRKLGTGSDVGSAGAQGLLSLSATDTVDLRVRCTSGASADFTLENGNLSVSSV